MKYDADMSNGIFQADKYMYKHFKHYDRAFRILVKYQRHYLLFFNSEITYCYKKKRLG